MHENLVFSCLKHNGVAIINNALSDNECDKIKKIFNSINDHSAESEILFVGGCVRQNILG